MSLSPSCGNFGNFFLSLLLSERCCRFEVTGRFDVALMVVKVGTTKERSTLSGSISLVDRPPDTNRAAATLAGDVAVATTASCPSLWPFIIAPRFPQWLHHSLSPSPHLLVLFHSLKALCIRR
ncbi:unnamed protein product [Linum trigynum]|uniref:Secreted protein n=1 Tax=Linum trigynum TaxID=586398 RepID=A0AAV2FTA1_9ROSI